MIRFLLWVVLLVIALALGPAIIGAYLILTVIMLFAKLFFPGKTKIIIKKEK